jgi:hypothetical protein
MIHLMKKFSFMYILYPVLLLGFGLPLFNHDRVTGPDPLGLSFAIYLAPMVWLVLGAMWSHEQMENKANGYAFLRTLPIEPRLIVRAKFAMVFLSVLLYVGGCCVAFAIISTDPDYLIPSCGYLILHGDVCLVAAALLYLGIFRFGFSRFGKFVLISWVCLFTAPLPIRLFILRPRGINDFDIMQFMRGPAWIAVTVIGLAAYFFLMRQAVRIMKFEEIQAR